MRSVTQRITHRLLIVDDNEAIHEDLRKILSPPSMQESALDLDEEVLFGARPSNARTFLFDSAFQGQEGLALVERAMREGNPYAMAFVDVRMPPGWDGIETTSRLWEVDPDLQIVICTAYTDYSWREITGRLGQSDNFVILKKPFENIEVVQLVHALTAKRGAMQMAREQLREAKEEVGRRRQTEQELVRVLREAEEANRCKREFLSTVSHELRTPLNAILGYSEMLEDDARQAGMAQFIPALEKVQMAGRHLLELINDILDMSGIESGRIPIQLEPVAVARMAEETFEMARPLASKHNNQISLQVSGDNLWMQVDEMRFRQCLLNLLGNACKFTADGVVALRVQPLRSGGQDCIEWSVMDTGIGIAADQIPTLFQPFRQMDSTITRRFGGSGLGLAISQRLCALMGGSITVDSRLGEGSVFTILIPAAAAPAEFGGEGLENGNRLSGGPEREQANARA
jgi:two-component system, sensor histidine kinase and response regulator